MAISQCAGLQLPSLSSWPQAQAGGPVPLNEDSARHWWRPRKELKQGRKAGAVQVPRWQWQSPGEGRRGSCRRCRSRDSPQTSQLRPNSADLYQPLMVESSSPADDGSPRKALRVVPEAAVLGASLLLLLAPAAWADGGGGTDTGWAAAVGEALYALGQNANALVQGQIQGGLTLTSGAVILGAGLVTSLSPCTLSVLPLTIGYIGGYDQGRSRAALVRDAAAFSLGLATTLAALGTGASLAGKAYGQVGAGLPIAASLTAMLMGLNLLEVLPLRFPSFLGNVDARELAAGLPSSVQAYLAGLVFALAASPCSTPVLATLLSYVATTQDPVVGSALLFTYTLGYVAPLLAAASFTGALKQLLELRKFSAWINPASGCLLLSGGLYTFLLRVVPAQ